MCGRYSLAPPHRLTKSQLDYLSGLEFYPPVYNVAPSMTMPIVRMADGRPQIVGARWGLVPFWAKDPKIGYKLINARAETVAIKPAFKYAYKARRCLIPVSGYFEWQQALQGQSGHGKQPFYFTSRDGTLLTLAGLWEHWTPEQAGPQDDAGVISYAVIVCESNALSAHVHHRMPVVIEDKDWHAWLSDADPEPLLKPCPDELLRCYAVSTAVNRPGNEGPQLIAPIENAPDTLGSVP